MTVLVRAQGGSWNIIPWNHLGRNRQAVSKGWRPPAATAPLLQSQDPDDYAWHEDDDDYFLDEADRPLHLHASDALRALPPQVQLLLSSRSMSHTRSRHAIALFRYMVISCSTA